MIFPSSASSEWFGLRSGKARWLGLALLFAGLGGCAISMPLPGLMDKETTGSIAKPAVAESDSSRANSVTPAAMQAEATSDAAAKPGLAAN